MTAKVDVAVVGATGLVGSALVELINDNYLPVGTGYLLASMNSAGEEIEVHGKYVRVELVEQFDFTQVQLALFAAPEDVSTQYIPKAVEAGATVIDVSGALVADTNVPIIVPEVNGSMVESYRHTNIIGSPSAGAVALAMALKPLHDVAGLVQVNVTLCEPASSLGKAGADELAHQTARLLSGQDNEAAEKVAFNVLPQLGQAQESGYTRSEIRVAFETIRLLGQTQIAINASSVQVPVFFGHTLSVQLTTQQTLSVEAAMAALEDAGVRVATDEKPSATALEDAVGSDDVWVSRLRRNLTQPNGLNFTIVSDNLRKGSALNMLHIAQQWLQQQL